MEVEVKDWAKCQDKLGGFFNGKVAAATPTRLPSLPRRQAADSMRRLHFSSFLTFALSLVLFSFFFVVVAPSAFRRPVRNPFPVHLLQADRRHGSEGRFGSHGGQSERLGRVPGQGGRRVLR